MQSVRRALYVLILIVCLAGLALPAFTQQVIATIPVGCNAQQCSTQSGNQ